MVFMGTYFGPDDIKGVKNLLETGIFTTSLKNNNTHYVED